MLSQLRAIKTDTEIQNIVFRSLKASPRRLDRTAYEIWHENYSSYASIIYRAPVVSTEIRAGFRESCKLILPGRKWDAGSLRRGLL